MHGLLKRPDIRLAYWLLDHLDHHRFWFPCDLPQNFRTVCLDLPAPTSLGTKLANPRWRHSYPWILLRVAGPRSYRMIYFTDRLDEIGMQTIFPVTTEHVAMRLGGGPISVVAVDDGKVWRPEEVSYDAGSHDRLIIGDVSEIKRRVARARSSVTFI